MPTDDLLLGINHYWITLAVLALLLIATEVGVRIGRRNRKVTDSASLSQLGALEAAMLGVLGLLLAFTFSMAASRHDARRDMVVAESNAIGTAYLRLATLDHAAAEAIRSMMREYVDLRMSLAQHDMNWSDIRRVRQQISQLQTKIWTRAINATSERAVTPISGLVLASLNEMFDMQAARDAAALARVPTVILALLSAVGIVSMGVVGVACGLGSRRNGIGTTLLSLLIAGTLGVVLDLDRPRSGTITISQRTMTELRESMK